MKHKEIKMKSQVKLKTNKIVTNEGWATARSTQEFNLQFSKTKIHFNQCVFVPHNV
jgi:hypothetical protein